MARSSDFDEKAELIKIVGATAELMESELSDAAAEMLVSDLLEYPYDQVVAALVRCRREVTGKLTLAAILSRLDDGRPGPEEAWAMMPAGEEQSVVWTDEMASAFGAVHHMIADDHLIEARMAFKEIYTKLISEGRANGMQPRWMLSPGRDPEGRKDAVREALDKGRLTRDRALAMLPELDEAPVTSAPRLESDRPATAGDLTQQFDQLHRAVEDDG